ncbi:arylsulfatase [Verrucomicrobiales bacterium]|nr:arylsulfatase [Verrucomicrobiales bacterium]
MKRILPLFLCLATSFAVAAEKPNIIVIMADDMGYGDLSCYGTTSFETPHIDQLAAEGQRFTSGYCSASTCTPTRWSFLTGTYAFREKGTGIAPPNGHMTINPDTTTLPDLMGKAGYKAAVIGKWHLGLGAKGVGPDWNGELKPGPLEIGFDHCFLLPTTNDRVPQVYLKDHRILNLDPKDPLWVGMKKSSEDHPTGQDPEERAKLKMDWSHGHNSTIHNGISRIGFYTGGHAARFRDEDLADKWVEQSKAWLDANKDDPFFLFFASHDLHVPRIPHERFQGATKLGYRADAIVQLDWCVGELMKKVDELGIADNTLFVFCSDNGPVMDDGYKDFALEKLGTHDANGPYSGGKYSVYEGGTRTPFITRWKGRIKPGVSEELVCTIDLAASLSSFAGVKLGEEDCRDSFDVMGALLGEDGAKGRDHLVQQDNGGRGNWGFREGNWKLHRNDKGQARNAVVAQTLTNTKVNKFRLFNIENDPTEQKDVAAENPEKFEEMKTKLQALIKAGRSR